MTIFKRSGRPVTLVILVAAMFSIAGHAALPENSFACQVETRNSGHALVRVQAHTMQAARKIALESEDALTLDRRRAPATALVQCVEAPGGRFADTRFQIFYENVER